MFIYIKYFFLRTIYPLHLAKQEISIECYDVELNYVKVNSTIN